MIFPINKYKEDIKINNIHAGINKDMMGNIPWINK